MTTNGTQIISLSEALAEQPERQPRKLTLDEMVDLYMAELYDSDGEVTLRLETLDGLIDEKALAYKHVGRKLDAKIAGQKAELDHIKQEAARVERRIEAIEKEKERLVERLADAMRETGKTSIQTVLGKIGFRKYPVVKLPEGWAAAAVKDYPQYVQVTPESYAPKKAVLKTDFMDMVKRFEKSGHGESDAWKLALEQMPEGFDVDPNEQLKGI